MVAARRSFAAAQRICRILAGRACKWACTGGVDQCMRVFALVIIIVVRVIIISPCRDGMMSSIALSLSA